MTRRATTIRERRRTYRLARFAVLHRYHTHLTLQEVARTVAASPRSVQRAYAQFGTMSFHEELVARRLDAATRLLSDTPMAVAEVAQRVGYRQPPHFARMFRRHYGIAPSAYRARMLKARRQHSEASGA